MDVHGLLNKQWSSSSAVCEGSWQQRVVGILDVFLQQAVLAAAALEHVSAHTQLMCGVLLRAHGLLGMQQQQQLQSDGTVAVTSAAAGVMTQARSTARTQ
jgi:hypothetical protein